MQYDEELMIKDLETLFKAELNTEIGKINTEKGSVSGDPLFMDDINPDKYIFETLDKRLLNYTGFFLMYGLVDTPISEGDTNNFIENVVVTFQIGTFDKGEKDRSNTMYKLLRYRRALKQVILKSPDVFRSYAKPVVSSLKPDALPYSSKKIILKIGIDIAASATAD